MKLDPNHVDHWTSGALDLPPALELEDVPALHAVRAYQLVGLEAGVGLRLGLVDGRTTDIYLNPVLARMLLSSIVKGGQGMGWMDEQANLVTE